VGPQPTAQGRSWRKLLICRFNESCHYTPDVQVIWNWSPFCLRSWTSRTWFIFPYAFLLLCVQLFRYGDRSVWFIKSTSVHSWSSRDWLWIPRFLAKSGSTLAVLESPWNAEFFGQILDSRSPMTVSSLHPQSTGKPFAELFSLNLVFSGLWSKSHASEVENLDVSYWRSCSATILALWLV
jgi:hypothetical protein